MPTVHYSSRSLASHGRAKSPALAPSRLTCRDSSPRPASRFCCNARSRQTRMPWHLSHGRRPRRCIHEALCDKVGSRQLRLVCFLVVPRLAGGKNRALLLVHPRVIKNSIDSSLNLVEAGCRLGGARFRAADQPMNCQTEFGGSPLW